VDGKLHFSPSQSLETDRPAVDPAPDVDGLWAVLPRLIALPEDLTTASQRAKWKAMLAELPAVPQGRTDAAGKHPSTPAAQDPNGRQILLTAAQWTPSGPNGKAGNVENPELYGVFPYGLFGVGMPGLELARNTFAARRFVGSTCWGQDGEDAATLGLTADAQHEAVANFTAYGAERFQWFWKRGHDWEPDMDNGGAGMTILQRMLLQTRGNRLLLFPAWPKEWNVDFKLHAPGNTTVEGTFRDGKVQSLSVTPKARTKDLVILQPQ
jgi:alpha-L-fucosidase 2